MGLFDNFVKEVIKEVFRSGGPIKTPYPTTVIALSFCPKNDGGSCPVFAERTDHLLFA